MKVLYCPVCHKFTGHEVIEKGMSKDSVFARYYYVKCQCSKCKAVHKKKIGRIDFENYKFG